MSILTHTMSVYLGNGRTLDDNRDNVNAMTNMWPSVTWIFSAIQFNKHYITWGLFDCASSSWNKVKCQLDATRQFYWCILSSTCFGYIRTSSGALDIELQHMVFCTEYLGGRWSWEPLRRPCVQCEWCRATLYNRSKEHNMLTSLTQKMSTSYNSSLIRQHTVNHFSMAQYLVIQTYI